MLQFKEKGDVEDKYQIRAVAQVQHMIQLVDKSLRHFA